MRLWASFLSLSALSLISAVSGVGAQTDSVLPHRLKAAKNRRRSCKYSGQLICDAPPKIRCTEASRSFARRDLRDDLNETMLARLAADGFNPCAVVETSDGNFQAWLKHPAVFLIGGQPSFVVEHEAPADK